MDTTAFGSKLRKLREEKGISQTQLATLAGLTRSGVSKIELGDREPSWGVVQKLAGALGVDCTVFMDKASAPVEEEKPATRPTKKKK